MTGAYTHNGDADLMRELGLKVDGFGSEWTPLGTVVVEEARPDGEYGARPAATVDVEVIALPAQAWRFTITRPRDGLEMIDGKVRGVYEPLEHFVMETGSGGFGDYWPTAKMVAQHMLDIAERPEQEPCQAVLYYGPGHQSTAHCRVSGPHAVHEAVYGEQQFAEWTEDEAVTGFFDEPPQ